MGDLPVEVVEHILKYLISLEDRKSASLVCLQWYRAYMNPYFRTLEVVQFTTDAQFKMFAKMEYYHRKYLHFVMKNVEITEGSLPFWEARGKHIKTLSFQSCFMRQPMFVNALAFCTNLESLTLQDCKELFMSGMKFENDQEYLKLRYAWKNLRTLNLSYNRYLSDSILAQMLTIGMGINSVNLTGCQITYHYGMFRKFYPNQMTRPSESVTTFQIILDSLRTHSNRIKSLSLSDTLIDSTSLHNLSLTDNLELRSLQLRSCMQISNQGLMQMCSTDKLKSLTELDVGLCPRITDTSLITLCSSLRQLTKFSLQGCRAITDMGLANIWQLDKLESLNLAECESIHGTGILKGLCHKTNYNLREIRLSHMGNLTETVVIGMVEGMPNLRHLDLGFCYNAVTDVSLQAIFRHVKWLRTLNLAMCDRITDCGLTGMGVFEQPIGPKVAQALRLPLGSRHEVAILMDAKVKEEVRELCESKLLGADKTGLSVSSLRGLRFLILTGCNRVSNVSLKYAFYLPELQTLDLSHCQQVSSDGLEHLVRNCTAIENLNLDMCQNVDDEAVEVIVRNLKRLKSLVVGSNKVTNNVADLIQYNARRLAHVDLRHCPKVLAPGISYLYQSMPFLRTFHYPEPPLEMEQPPVPPPFGLWLRRS